MEKTTTFLLNLLAWLFFNPLVWSQICDSTLIELMVCEDELAYYQGNYFAPNSHTSFIYQNVNGCDSLVTISVLERVVEIYCETQAVSCFGQTNGRLEIMEVVNGAPPLRYSLDGFNYQADPIFENIPPNLYTVFIEDVDGCVYTTEALVFQPLYWEIDPSPPQEILEEDSVQLSLTYNTFLDVMYEWFPSDGLSCTNCPNPIASPEMTTTYQAILTDQYGCEKMGELTVNVLPNDTNLLFPTAFSPNGDGQNDVFRGLSQGVIEFFHLKIFNRWGEPVFETNNFESAWNGKHGIYVAPVGTYTYMAKATFRGGVVREVRSSFLLIR